MATQITNYQCPACTGPLHFVGASGMLECDYCDMKYTVKEIEELYSVKDDKAEAAFEKASQKAKSAEDDYGWGADAENMRSYNCPSCGAELICDSTTAATSCPYCGNPTIVPGQFGGTRRPDYVIPFKLNKDEAISALRKHYKKKPLIPSAFSKENHIKEIKGIYVPFWLYSCEAGGEVRYDATKVRTWREGDYLCTETSFYDVQRSGNAAFENIPVDGSSKMPDAHMDSIEPYDYSDLKDFSVAYLPGFLADKYDVGAEECASRALLRAERSVAQELRNTVIGYTTVTETSNTVRTDGHEVKYGLLPVWMLYTKWKDKDYLFAMNGQTGKLIGDLPVSVGKFFAWFLGLGSVLSAVAVAVRMLI